MTSLFRFCVLALALSTAAPAQRASNAGRVFEELAQCRMLPADAERLACFERLTDRAAAPNAGDVAVTDRAEVARERRRGFGLGGEEVPTAVEKRVPATREVDSIVRSVAPAREYGRWNMELANGTVWQTIDPLSFGPRAGLPIKLRSAPLGGYRALIKGGRSILVKRLR